MRSAIDNLDVLPCFGPASAGIPLTPEEFDAVEDYDDRWVYELINGVLVVTPIPPTWVRDVNEQLGYLIRSHEELGRDRERCLTINAQTLHFGSNRRRAERVIWCGLGRVPMTSDPPTIVVDYVLASGRNQGRDLLAKKAEYREFGVQEYWIFDRFARRLTVTHLQNRKEVVIQSNDEAPFYETAHLPGFEFPLNHLLEHADLWPGVEDEYF